MAEKKLVAVHYIGDGESFLPGVPMSDHEADEEIVDELIASGLYERVTGSSKRRDAADTEGDK